jgi:hypothetical protein
MEHAAIKIAIDEAQAAWEDGFAIIAARLNVVLHERHTGLTIHAYKPPPGETLGSCRERLAQALGDIPMAISDLADDPDLHPWTLGFVNDLSQPERKIGSRGFDEMFGLDVGLATTIAELRTSHLDWTPQHWRHAIVGPVEASAQQWSLRFSEMEAKLAKS